MKKLFFKILSASLLAIILVGAAILAQKSSAAVVYDFNLQKLGAGKGMLKVKTVFNSQPYDFDCGYQSYGFYINGAYGSDCYFSGGPGWDEGTQAAIYAEPEPFYSVLTGWTGCSPSAANPFLCSFTLNADALIKPEFKSAYSITVAKKGTGDGSVTWATYPSGLSCGNDCYEEFSASFNVLPPSSVVLAAAADSNSQFISWDGCDETAPGSCTIYNLLQKKITAVFNRIPRTLTINKSGTGSGAAVSDPAGIYCGSGADCSAQFGQGVSVTLTAFKDAGSVFVGWTGCDSVNGAVCVATMGASNKTITAQFNSL